MLGSACRRTSRTEFGKHSNMVARVKLCCGLRILLPLSDRSNATSSHVADGLLQLELDFKHKSGKMLSLGREMHVANDHGKVLSDLQIMLVEFCLCFDNVDNVSALETSLNPASATLN